MTMRQEYIDAIETRLRWAKACDREAVRADWGNYGTDRAEGSVPYGLPLLLSYKRMLEHGELFVMSPPFCALVEHAAQSMPDDVTFDPKWLQTQAGWLYLATPFFLPEIEEARKLKLHIEPDGSRLPVPRIRIRAVSWDPIPSGPKAGSWQLQVYADFGWFGTDYDERIRRDPGISREGGALTAGFFPCSHFALRDGDALAQRIENFEHFSNDPTMTFHPGHYVEGPDRWRHEMRWLYAAFHLMSQRLTTRTRVQTDRHTRRRAERTKQTAPPFVTVITLRRLEADRTRDPKGEAPEWQWQWSVVGHWRSHWYPSEGVHKRIFIESYVKGPADKPFKNTLKLFAAKR